MKQFSDLAEYYADPLDPLVNEESGAVSNATDAPSQEHLVEMSKDKKFRHLLLESVKK